MTSLFRIVGDTVERVGSRSTSIASRCGQVSADPIVTVLLIAISVVRRATEDAGELTGRRGVAIDR